MDSANKIEPFLFVILKQLFSLNTSTARILGGQVKSKFGIMFRGNHYKNYGYWLVYMSCSDFEALNRLPPRITRCGRMLHLTTEPPIFCR